MKRLKASSLVELVIALSIISICLVVASRVFVQNSKSTIKFRDVKIQSEFQSLVFNALRSDTLPELKDWSNDDFEIKTMETPRNSKFRKVYFVESVDKKLWQQEFSFE